MKARIKFVAESLKDVAIEMQRVMTDKPTKADMIAHMDYWSNQLNEYHTLLKDLKE